MLCYQDFQERKEESDLFQRKFQEEDGSSRFIDSGAIDNLSLLHLNSAVKRRPAAITAENGTSCGASMKRSSPTFVSSLPEPSPKRPTLLPPSPSFSPPVDGATATKPQPSFLYRSFSEPIDTTGLLNARSAENAKTVDFCPVSASGGFLSPSPEISKTTGAAFKKPSPPMNPDFLPPLPPLCRSISDPFAASDFQAPQAAATPPKRPARPQTIKSPPSSAEESPSTKRLQAKMKAGMRKMRQWCDQLMQEVVADEKEDTLKKNEKKGAEEEDEEEEEEKGSESVWVEKAGEGLVIHFKCPCKKGYEILLAGNNCYYKLI